MVFVAAVLGGLFFSLCCRYRSELKDAQASLALTKLPDNEVLVSLVAENASLKRNTAKLLKEATAAEGAAAAAENTRLRAKVAALEAENQALVAEVGLPRRVDPG